jgi:DNA end-binding protein Ku
VVLRPYEHGLILHTMYYADEVRDFDAIDVESGHVSEKETKLAEMLINELTVEKFNALQFKDEYRQRLLERIRAKSKGKPIVSEEEPEEKGGEVVDIMEALRRSLQGGRAPAKRAPASRTAHKSSSARSTKRTSARTATKRRKAS